MRRRVTIGSPDGTILPDTETAGTSVVTRSLTGPEAEALLALLRAIEKQEQERLSIVSESPNDVRVRFEGDLKFGARTLFGPRDGARITEALARFQGEIGFETPQRRFGRVTFDGLVGGSQTADRIVPDQAAAEHLDATVGIGGFLTDTRVQSPNSYGSIAWEVQFRRIQADPIGIRDENAVNVLPFVFEKGGELGKARAAFGLRYEDTRFDRDFLQSVGSLSENEDSNIGLYCEVRGDVRSEDATSFRFQPYLNWFLRDFSSSETVRVGFDASVNPIPPELRGDTGWTQRCMVGVTLEYADFGNDPIKSAKYLGLFMGVRF